MQPRIVFRTHYQVDEPAYMECLVKSCTSPVRSAYREVVAQKLANEVNRLGKKFNAAAGEYAVDLAKDLGLITDNHTWTDRGQLVGLFAETDGQTWAEQLPLTMPEKLMHFRVFLQGDGAALLFIARRMIETRVSLSADSSWNALAKDMFIEVFSSYLAITNNTADRVKLRRDIERLKAAEYKGNTGAHKVFVHLQTLYRLGLVELSDVAQSREYRLPSSSPDAPCGLVLFAEAIPNVSALENLLKNHKWIELAVRVFQFHPTECTDTSSFPSWIAPQYQCIMRKGISLCPISTLIEAVQIELLSKDSQLLSWGAALDALEAFQKEFPKCVRFHVDRRGHPSFVKISDDLLMNYREQKVER